MFFSGLKDVKKVPLQSVQPNLWTMVTMWHEFQSCRKKINVKIIVKKYFQSFVETVFSTSYGPEIQKEFELLNKLKKNHEPLVKCCPYYYFFFYRLICFLVLRRWKNSVFSVFKNLFSSFLRIGERSSISMKMNLTMQFLPQKSKHFFVVF